MSNLKTVEIKAFIPAQDFDRAKSFYQDLGFQMAWNDYELAYFHHGDTSFLLQNFYVKDLAENLMMHLLVEDVEAWWQIVQHSRIAEKYGVKVIPPGDRPWKMRDFVIHDPSGVLWRIGQNI
ncbi:VOC family protein [Alkalinema pantanalense CENA528]|uniref:VOC family protein n=1 Tax=Alkalinema pantanalense TaxID=1620705 RepID=UPI003D6E1AC5